jgi:SAM-dependent methyltransferase
MQEEWFKNWFDTTYYHELYKNRDNNEASLFIDKLVKKIKPPSNSNMLDIGCGKGRHAIQLANLGFDVTGIDLSKASIEEALKQEKENLHFYQHDMREIFWINYFDYAFNLFTSFGYFNSKRENNNAIQSIAQSLKNGGKLVVDYLNVHFTEQNMVHQGKELINNVEYTITRWHDEHKFYKKIRTRVHKLYTTSFFLGSIVYKYVDRFCTQSVFFWKHRVHKLSTNSIFLETSWTGVVHTP